MQHCVGHRGQPMHGDAGREHRELLHCVHGELCGCGGVCRCVVGLNAMQHW